MKYLIDTSALVRLWRGQVDTGWRDLAGRGLIAICEPALAEALLMADAKSYRDVEQEFLDTYLMVTIPEGVWDLMAALRRELVPHSAHQGLSVADLVIAATAIRLKLEVLHEDSDFETVQRFVPELRQRRVSSPPQ